MSLELNLHYIMFINVVLNALPKGECEHLDTIYNLKKRRKANGILYVCNIIHISLPEVITGTPDSEYQTVKNLCNAYHLQCRL